MSEHGGYSTTTLAADRKRWTLEEKLPHAFLKLEEKAAKDDERRQERLRREKLRRDEWEAAMARARLEYFAQKRHEWLEEQLARWCRVRDMREFVAAARCDRISARKTTSGSSGSKARSSRPTLSAASWPRWIPPSRKQQICSRSCGDEVRSDPIRASGS